jgi:hypothetical protein
MSLNDVRMCRRKAKLIYPDRRHPPQSTEDAAHARSNRLLGAPAKEAHRNGHQHKQNRNSIYILEPRHYGEVIGLT